jgi:hypothetical protein
MAIAKAEHSLFGTARAEQKFEQWIRGAPGNISDPVLNKIFECRNLGIHGEQRDSQYWPEEILADGNSSGRNLTQ